MVYSIIFLYVLFFLLLLMLIFGVLWSIKILNDYNNSIYHRSTGNDFFDLIKNRKSGKLHEYLVYKTISKQYKPGDNAYYLFNKGIDKSDSDYSEIDLIFIHNTGIYVIEAKDWNCSVNGFFRNQYLDLKYKNKTRSEYNPIRQNETHIEILKKFLNDNNVQNKNLNFYSVVVFGNKCDISRLDCNGSDCLVVKKKELLKKLNEAIHQRKDILSYNDRLDIFNLINSISAKTEEEKRIHNENCKSKRYYRRNTKYNNSTPKIFKKFDVNPETHNKIIGKCICCNDGVVEFYRTDSDGYCKCNKCDYKLNTSFYRIKKGQNICKCPDCNNMLSLSSSGKYYKTISCKQCGYGFTYNYSRNNTTPINHNK